MAEAYRTHRWLPTEANVRHGKDRRGVRIDTPDISYQLPGAVPGWWTPGEWAESMPYQWGGFSTLDGFDQGLADGRAAGDVYTREKRLALEHAVSEDAVGIDCSGFVSRCWGLPRAFSTRELATLCDPLRSWQELQPGDLLNTYNAHCMIFVGWADAQRSRLFAVEAGSSRAWKVLRREHDVSELMGFGYQALRYRFIRDG